MNPVILLISVCVWPAAPLTTTAPSNSAEAFSYDQPTHLEAREVPPRNPSTLRGTRQRQTIFKNIHGHDVPVLITTPDQGKGDFRTVLLLHGFGGNKEEITAHAGAPLLQAGFACIAPDLPLHGQRPGSADNFFTTRYEESYRYVQEAVTDIRQTIDLAATQKDLNTSSGIALVGYSMGTWLGSLAAAAEPRVRVMILMSGGSAVSLPDAASGPADPNASGQQKTVELRNALIRTYPAFRHESALARFTPHPLLLQNGRRDELATPQRVQTLYTAAGEPKTLRWYDSGHSLPRGAFHDAAEWLQKNWGTIASRPF